jgi:phenylacetate-CoA ligase
VNQRLLLGGVAATVGKFLNRRSVETAYRLASRSSSPYTLQSIQQWKLRRTLQHAARHSAFYRDRFQQRGLQVDGITHPAELDDIFTTPQDLLDHPSDAFLCGPAQVIYETSGTTKQPKTLYYSHTEVDEATSLMAVGLYHVGIRPTDRVLSSSDYHYWNGGPWFARAITKIGAFGAFPGKIPPADIFRRLDAHGYNVLIGDVSWILRLTELAEERGAPRLKLIVGASEGLPERSREFIEDVWGAKMFMCYGCTEGAGGMECSFRHGYHLNEFSYFFEILNPNADGYGELVFTTLDRMTMPLIRYRIGDVARLVPGSCGCGIVTQRLSTVRGRSDEVVMLGGEAVDPAMFEAILSPVPQISGNWQAAIRHRNHQDLCELRLELIGGDIATVSAQIKEVLRTKFDTLWKDYQLGLFDLEFTEVPRGELRKERKLRRLLDERRWETDRTTPAPSPALSTHDRTPLPSAR